MFIRLTTVFNKYSLLLLLMEVDAYLALPCWQNYYSKLDQLIGSSLILYILYKHDQYKIHLLTLCSRRLIVWSQT